MGKRKTGADDDKNDRPFPKQQSDGGPDDFVSPDRPDQVSMIENPAEETIDVIEGSSTVDVRVDDKDEKDEGREDNRREDRSEDDRRARADDDDDRPLRSEDDDDDQPRGRRRHGRAVQRRINREVALRHQSDSRYEESQRRLRATEARLAKLERVTTDVQGDTTVKAMETEIAGLQSQLKAALEADDSKRAFEIQTQIGEKQVALALKKQSLEQERKQAIKDEEARAAQEEDSGEGGKKPMPPNARDWLDNNKHWYKLARFKDAATDVAAIDKQINAEIQEGRFGFERYSVEFFDELNHRLLDLYPDLKLRDLDGNDFDPEQEVDDEEDDDMRDDERDDRRDNGRYSRGRDTDRRQARRDDRRDDRRDARRDDRNGSRRAPQGGMGGRQGRREQSEADLARAGKVRLTDKDFTQMRVYGLDPNNKEHKKRFAQERMRTVLTEERRRGAR